MSSNMNAPQGSQPFGGYIERGPELPQSYGVTRLVILPRDPRWIHCYWEIASYTWQEIERTVGGAARSSGRPVIRFFTSDESKFFDVPVHIDARNWYIQMPEGGGFWVAEIGLVLPDGRFVRLARSNQIKMPSGQVSNVLDEKWGIVKAEWERLFQLSGGGKLGAGSLEITKMLAQRWEFLKSISSWPGSAGISSLARPAAPGIKGFWLRADCELIVYGATEADAKVTVQGQPIALNPDGTFSLRFALPDGTLNIPIEATSADGDFNKGIAFTVSRSTDKSRL